MNKKKLYKSIMESISRLVKKVINETIDFNTSDVFNKEESYYDYNEKDSLIYRNIEDKILNNKPITEEESIYYFKIKQKIPDFILKELINANDISNEILNGILINKLKYKVESERILKSIILNYSFYNINRSLNWIDTSNITNMSELFAYSRYNGDISEWDTSNVTDMSWMFQGSLLFNHPIGKWNVSNVTNMSGMFHGAEKFNQSIGDWDVRNVTNINYMFYKAKKFNQNLSNWKLYNIKEYKESFNLCPIINEYKPKNIE